MPDAPPACAADTARRFGFAYQYGALSGALPGARVCIEGTSECTIADSIGAFSLCTSTTTDFGLRVSFGGYESATYLFDAAFAGPFGLEIGSENFVQTLWADSGASFPPTTHSLLFVGLVDAAGGLANATVTIQPSAGTISYGDANQVAHRAGTSTSSSGTVYVGNLPPGMYDVMVTASPQVTCANVNLTMRPTPVTSTTGGFESPNTGSAIRAPTFAGSTTVVFLRCTP